MATIKIQRIVQIPLAEFVEKYVKHPSFAPTPGSIRYDKGDNCLYLRISLSDFTSLIETEASMRKGDVERVEFDGTNIIAKKALADS